MKWFVAIVALGAVGCGPPAPTPENLPQLDYEYFEAVVQPVLVEGCSNPSSCHGDPGRPLTLYAPGAHRLRPEDQFANTELTTWEVRANYDRVRSFAVDGGAGVLLLRKPLAVEAGGVDHIGVDDIFRSTDDRGFQIIEAWIEGAEIGADAPGGHR